MSIPASNIVNVIPRVIKAGGKALQLNGLVLTQNPDCPVGKVLFFNNAAEVSTYFGATSTLAQYAPCYFKGYNNSFKKPATLYVVNATISATSAYLRGAGKPSTLAHLKEIEAGTLTFMLDGVNKELVELNFSSATSFSNVATIIQSAFDTASINANISYSSTFNAFVVRSTSTGAESSVGFFTGTCAKDLGLDEESGGVQSIGRDATTLDALLNEIITITNNWVSLTTEWQATDEEILLLRHWANSFNSRYWSIGWVNKDPKYLSIDSVDHVAKTLKDEAIGSGNLVLGIELAFFEMGMIASVNYDAKVPARGKITYMFKQQDGITFNVDTEIEAEALKFWGISFYGNWATANDNFKFFAHGNTWGQCPFIDTAIDAIWLNNAIQLSLMTLLSLASALPYNEEGYSRIRSTLMGEGGPVAKALANGVIRAGVTLNSTQRDQVDAEAGLEIHPTLEANGYYVQVLAPDADVRQDRGTPEINLWYTDGGAIQKIEIASTAIL